MSIRVAVSFENKIIRVVYASDHRGKLAIRKTLELRDEEFDDFLRKEKTGHFTVVCDFTVLYQDVLLLPPVAEKYLRPLIESEVKKKFPELTDFSFFYSILGLGPGPGENRQEGRKKMEVFVYVVTDEDISLLVERFGRHGKIIKHLYPNAFALSQMVKVHGGADEEPVLCVTGSGPGKTFFLMNRGTINLVRGVHSPGSGLHDLDVQNINMTVNYCRQTLRITPSRIILLGASCTVYAPTINFLAPVACLGYPANVDAGEGTPVEFITPVSALLPSAGMEKGDILPEKVRGLQHKKRILAYAAAFFLLLSIAGLVAARTEMSAVASLKEQVRGLETEISAMGPVRNTYEARYREIRKLLPYVDFINSAQSGADIGQALIALQAVSMKDVTVHSIDIREEGAVLLLQIKGNISAKNYSDLQKTYQNLLGTLERTGGMHLSARRLELMNKSFHLEARYGS